MLEDFSYETKGKGINVKNRRQDKQGYFWYSIKFLIQSSKEKRRGRWKSFGIIILDKAMEKPKRTKKKNFEAKRRSKSKGRKGTS